MTKSFPLTPIQEAMFGASHLAARPWLYVEQVVVDMPGERLDAQAMQAAWRDLAMVHPVLRIRIVAEDGQLPVQQVSAEVDVPVSVEDFAALSADKAEAAFDAFLANDRQRRRRSRISLQRRRSPQVSRSGATRPHCRGSGAIRSPTFGEFPSGTGFDKRLCQRMGQLGRRNP